jgi:hypothetical protein
MTLAADNPEHAVVSGALAAAELPPLPGRVMSTDELLAWVRALAARPDLWERHVSHHVGTRHYVSLHRDADVDVWLLCWNLEDDTGWHDHDLSSGAVAVTRGAVRESRPRLGGDPAERVVAERSAFAFGPDHIHRMGGSVDGSVSIHVYSPPLWRMGQYAIGADGEMRRVSVSYAEELRPLGA